MDVIIINNNNKNKVRRFISIRKSINCCFIHSEMTDEMNDELENAETLPGEENEKLKEVA